MIVYPTENYNSFVTTAEANDYFNERLNADEWFSAGSDEAAIVTEFRSINDEAALVTAFRSISELDIALDPTDAVQLAALKCAQCEQALHELKNDLDTSIGYLAMADIQLKREKAPRYSDRALAILRPYITSRTISMMR